MAQVEKDALTGTETTGHVWDGIRELNTPLPKWWLYTFYACIVWAVGYWVVYPAWPTLSGYSKGMIGYNSRLALHDDLNKQAGERAAWASRFEAGSVDEIAEDRQLLNYAMAGGKFIFNENCSACHGAGGQGGPGYPVLADDDWIWGGTRDAIYNTIRVGIRGEHDDTHISDMPNFITDGMISREEADAVAEYVMSLSGQGMANARGEEIFAEQCAACHGEDGKGNKDLGGPDLANQIWLNVPGTKEGVLTQLRSPKHGIMPSWEGRLSDVEIKQVALYVHSLGGGQ